MQSDGPVDCSHGGQCLISGPPLPFLDSPATGHIPRVRAYCYSLSSMREGAMKTLIASVAVITIMAGCVSPPLTYEEQRVQFKTGSNDELCLVTILKPEYSKAVEEELTERNATCDWNKVQLMMQARQMQQQQTLNALMLINSMQTANTYAPTSQPLKQNLNCRTQYNSWGATTNCW